MPDAPVIITPAFTPPSPSAPAAVASAYSAGSPSAPAVVTGAFSAGTPTAPRAITSAFSAGSPSAPAAIQAPWTQPSGPSVLISDGTMTAADMNGFSLIEAGTDAIDSNGVMAYSTDGNQADPGDGDWVFLRWLAFDGWNLQYFVGGSLYGTWFFADGSGSLPNITPDEISNWTAVFGEASGTFSLSFVPSVAAPSAISSAFSAGTPTAPRAITSAFSAGTPTAPQAITSAYTAPTPSAPPAITT